MTLKQLCMECQVPYDSQHSTDILSKIKNKGYIIEKNKRDYKIIGYNNPQLNSYNQLLPLVICSQLAQSPTKSLKVDMKQMLEMFHIVNLNYKYFTYEKIDPNKEQILNDNIEEAPLLYEFVQDVHPLLSRTIKKALNELVDKKLITYNEILIINIHHKINDVEWVEQREMTDEDISNYLNAARQMMLEEGYDRWSDVPYFTKGKINKRASKKVGASYISTLYHLILNKEGLYEEALSQMNLLSVKKLTKSKQGRLKEYDPQILAHCIDTLIKE